MESEADAETSNLPVRRATLSRSGGTTTRSSFCFEHAEDEFEQALVKLRESGAYERLREDLRLRAALDRLAADVKRIPVELAQARESIWTPEKDKPETSATLWTPGSKEPA